MVGNDKAVNPFVQKMYFRISFHTWLNIMRKKESQKKHEVAMKTERDRAKRLGLAFIERKLEEEKRITQVVSYEIDKYKFFTDEENSDDEETV